MANPMFNSKQKQIRIQEDMSFDTFKALIGGLFIPKKSIKFFEKSTFEPSSFRID